MLTTKIDISLKDLFTLYSFFIPNIIFYTLPLSFVSALANTLSKLSQDNELIALFSLGIKAKKVLSAFLLLGALFSLLLFTIAFFAMPVTEQLYQSFKVDKKAEAKLNIKSGELGQKFGNYYIYVKETKDETYHDLVIYNRTGKNSEQFFASKTGQLNRNQLSTSLQLDEGYGYTYSDDKLQEIRYKKLEAFDTSSTKRYKYQNVIEYWMEAKTDTKRMHRVIFFVFVSLIPFLSVMLVASFTIINPRYQKNHSFLVTFIVTIVLYLIATTLQKSGNLTILAIVSAGLLILGYWLFKKRVTRYF